MPSPTKDKSTQPGFFPWEQRHTDALIGGIIQTVLQHKGEIYATPGLAGEVDGHGSDRIRSKVEQVLRRLAKEHGLDEGVVKASGARGKRKTAPTQVKEEHASGKKVKAE